MSVQDYDMRQVNMIKTYMKAKKCTETEAMLWMIKEDKNNKCPASRFAEVHRKEVEDAK